MCQLLSAFRRLLCFKAGQHRQLPGRIRKASAAPKLDSSNPSSSDAKVSLIPQGAAEERSTVAVNARTTSTLNRAEPARTLSQAITVEDEDEDEDGNSLSLDGSDEEAFDVDDIEDPELASHIFEILTRMRREPDLLPATDVHDDGDERHKQYWENIAFNERIFESVRGR